MNEHIHIWMGNCRICGCTPYEAELEEEIADLREQLRWRKYPEEKPKEGEQCDVWIWDGLFPSFQAYNGNLLVWENVRFWRPRGEPPKEQG